MFRSGVDEAVNCQEVIRVEGPNLTGISFRREQDLEPLEGGLRKVVCAQSLHNFSFSRTEWEASLTDSALNGDNRDNLRRLLAATRSSFDVRSSLESFFNAHCLRRERQTFSYVVTLEPDYGMFPITVSIYRTRRDLERVIREQLVKEVMGS